MTVLRKWNATTSVWDAIVTGTVGPTGPGVPAGGAAGQVLTKASATDHDTVWQAAGGSGELSYKEANSEQSVAVNTTTAVAGTAGIVSVTAGRVYRITARGLVSTTATGANPLFELMVDTGSGFVVAQRIAQVTFTNTTWMVQGVARYKAAATGSVTFQLGWRSGTGVSITMLYAAGGDYNAYMLVEDAGPASV